MSHVLPMAGRHADGDAPVFERIAIVGFGLIGGSLSLAIKRRWPSSLVIAVDKKDVLETAMRMHAADVGGDDLIMAAEAQLVVLAAPAQRNIELLQHLPEYLPGAATVTDVGSTKAAILHAAAALPDRLAFVGGHPLAGAAVGGIDSARADLFEERPWVLVPGRSATRDAVEQLERFISAVGARPTRLTAADHDRLVAYLSQLPQLAVTALMHVVGEHVGAEGLALAGRGLRDTTRLATSPAGIWREIVATNPDHISRAIDDLVAALGRLKGDAADSSGLEELFASAARWKAVLEKT